jgi:hypothetical protein
MKSAQAPLDLSQYTESGAKETSSSSGEEVLDAFISGTRLVKTPIPMTAGL